MTTLRQIITDAYREGGFIQIGTDPQAEELDEGLRKLQTLVRSLIGNEMGAPLASVSYGKAGLTNSFGVEQDRAPEIDNFFVPADTRLMANIDSAKTVYLDPNPNDGARIGVIDSAGNFATNNLTVNANGRKIEGATSVTLSANGTAKEWFYRSDTGDWVLVDTLTANSQNPFPGEFDDMLITLLAMRLNPRFQAQTAPETVEELKRLRRQFRARYKQVTEVRSEEGLVRLPSLGTWFYDDLSLSTSRFNRGLPH